MVTIHTLSSASSTVELLTPPFIYVPLAVYRIVPDSKFERDFVPLSGKV